MPETNNISGLEEFSYDPLTNLHNPPHAQSYGYSDGAKAEEYVYNAIAGAIDRSAFSDELEEKIIDWPSEYHLSRLRHNLLRHIPFKKTDKILELGAGCGAMTRYLGETRAQITAIEGSPKRAASAGARCRDLKNVKIYVSDFNKVKLTREYDYVLLIGVLEYSPVYFKGNNPVRDCLKIAHKALNSRGRLIIAIENQLGLKYFCGHPEDHTGLNYYGIEDRHKKDQPVTMGKKEISNVINMAGFKAIEFQYPFPDYKLPKFIFTEKAFNNDNFVPSAIISQLKRSQYDATDLPVNESLVWPTVEKNGLLGDMSNSFLILAGKRETKTDKAEDMLAVGYSVNRKKRYNTQTTFRQESRGRITVIKNLLTIDPNPDPEKRLLKHILKKQKYIKGQMLDSVMQRHILNNDFTAFLHLLIAWKEYLIKYGLKIKDSKAIGRSIMRPDFIDCIPQNIIIQKDELFYIDKEWETFEPFTLDTLLLRYLSRFYLIPNNIIDRNIRGNENSLIKLFNGIGLSLDEPKFTEFLLFEDTFYKNVLLNTTLRSSLLTLSNAPATKELSIAEKVVDRLTITAKTQKKVLNMFLKGRE